MPIAEVCVATGGAFTGASPPVLSSEAAAGADDGTSAMAAMACAADAVRRRRRSGGAKGCHLRPTETSALSNAVRTCAPAHPRPKVRHCHPGTAAQPAPRPEPAAAARVGACDASMSADAASNTVFVRNLPFNVSDEQVRCCALRQASRG